MIFRVCPHETSPMTIIIHLAKNLSRKTGVSRIMPKNAVMARWSINCLKSVKVNIILQKYIFGFIL